MTGYIFLLRAIIFGVGGTIFSTNFTQPFLTLGLIFAFQRSV